MIKANLSKQFITALSSLALIMMVNNSAYANNEKQPKNIIMVVADGMGTSYTTGYRYFNDDRATKNIEPSIFDQYLVGMISTYPDSTSGYVTDSAAAATTLASGVKTYNGAIGVDIKKQPLTSVLTVAKQQGKKTGVVVTSRINHATPAAYLTHNSSRENYLEIADSYVENEYKADVYFGGGRADFIRQDRDIINEFKQAGYQYIHDYQQLAGIKKEKPVIGLFADYALPAVIDDKFKHRLTNLTKTAIEQLDNDQGYFLLIEASQIDWAGHDNDIAKAMFEMSELAHTFKFLTQYVQQQGNTLIVLTADHSTGGLSLGKTEDYLWQPELIKNMKISVRKISTMLANKNKVNIKELNINEISKWLSFALTRKEFNKLQRVNKQFTKGMKEYENFTKAQQKEIDPPELDEFYRIALNNIINKRTNTGWTTIGHIADDVPVYALGNRSELFHGQQDNTDIGKKLLNLLSDSNNLQ